MTAVGCVAGKTEAQGGGKIRRLDETVVNKIAAGEVVHRPANALKELLENSLDAGSTSITVSAKAGGLKVLQIQDNGHGINVADMPIVCERFTTSKLKKFEDLKQIVTFGFRGEALASISHVAHVTITSKTKDQPCAYRARYSDGTLLPWAPREQAKPKPCAGVVGTQILVEDMFYNVPTRKRAFKNPNEEYHRILEVVQRYAIHYGATGVSFTCKKIGDANADLKTPMKCTTVDNIRAVYGQAVARELIALECQEGWSEELKSSQTMDRLSFRAKGYISNANYSLKRGVFIMFINGRLVENPGLKRTLESVYAEYLPKNSSPFIYLALDLPSGNVDVNVHPTKREVHFLFEQDVTDKLQLKIAELLQGANSSRTFQTQALFQTSSPFSQKERNKGDIEEIDGRSGSEDESDRPSEGDDSRKKRKGEPQQRLVQVELTAKKKSKYEPSKAPQKLVRTDHRTSRIDSFLLRSSPHVSEENGGSSQSKAEEGGQELTQSELRSLRKAREAEVPQLTSLQNLLKGVEQKADKGLREILQKHTYVGLVDSEYSLVQNGTKLLLVNHRLLASELFYQLTLRSFSRMPMISFSEGLPVVEMAEAAILDPSSGWTEEDGDPKDLAKEVAELLVSQRELLGEYYRIDIDPEGYLHSLPDLLDDYKPSTFALPSFVLRLATEVDWDEEQACLDGIAKELGMLFSVLPSADAPLSSHLTKDHPAAKTVEHCLYPAFRTELCPSVTLSSATAVTEVACLQKLYRVFERC